MRTLLPASSAIVETGVPAFSAVPPLSNRTAALPQLPDRPIAQTTEYVQAERADQVLACASRCSEIG